MVQSKGTSAELKTVILLIANPTTTFYRLLKVEEPTPHGIPKRGNDQGCRLRSLLAKSDVAARAPAEYKFCFA